MNPTILITGAAGFIGSQLAAYLVDTTPYEIIGTDIFDSVLDKDDSTLYNLKKSRLQIVKDNPNYTYIKHDLRNEFFNNDLFNEVNPTFIFHFGGRSGVASCEVDVNDLWNVNVGGTERLLAWANTKSNIKHVFISSSSSVYGNSDRIPYKESDVLGFYRGQYAKSKSLVESAVMFNRMSNNPNYKQTILRQFSVYGPYGRPDMAPWMLTDRHVSCLSPSLVNNGNTCRDYIYIDDVVNILSELVNGYNNISIPEILNIGTGQTISILELNSLIANITQSGVLPVLNPKINSFDMPVTMADTNLLNKTLWPDMPLAFTPIEEGMMQFIAWFQAMKIINKCINYPNKVQ